MVLRLGSLNPISILDPVLSSCCSSSRGTLEAFQLDLEVQSTPLPLPQGWPIAFPDQRIHPIKVELDRGSIARSHGDQHLPIETTATERMASPFPGKWYHPKGVRFHSEQQPSSQVLEKNTVIGMKLSKTEQTGNCETCAKEKHAKNHLPKRTTKRSSELLEIVQTYVRGPMSTASTGGAKYLVAFIDDKSRWCQVHFVAKKSQALVAFKKYKDRVENWLERRIEYVQSDKGTEFCTTEFENLLQVNGIQRKLTVPHTPQQDGVTERKNRTLLEMARCMIIQSKLAPSFWAEAISTANYLRNRCTSKSIDRGTPLKLWTGKRPIFMHLRSFGRKALDLDKTQPSQKLHFDWLFRRSEGLSPMVDRKEESY